MSSKNIVVKIPKSSIPMLKGINFAQMVSYYCIHELYIYI